MGWSFQKYDSGDTRLENRYPAHDPLNCVIGIETNGHNSFWIFNCSQLSILDFRH